MTEDFPLFVALKRYAVPFVVVGGHAVNFHGHLRMTEDSDVVWLRTPETEVALVDALTEVAASHIGKDIDPATGIERLHPISLQFVQQSHLMMLWTTHGFFDLFDYVPGHPEVDVSELFSSSEDWDGLRVASYDWLRRMKQMSGRSKDLSDLDELAKIARADSLNPETPPGRAG